MQERYHSRNSGPSIWANFIPRRYSSHVAPRLRPRVVFTCLSYTADVPLTAISLSSLRVGARFSQQVTCMVLPLLATHAVVVGQLEGVQVRDFDQDVFVDVTEIVAAGRDEMAVAAERDGLKVSMGEFSSGMSGD